MIYTLNCQAEYLSGMQMPKSFNIVIQNSATELSGRIYSLKIILYAAWADMMKPNTGTRLEKLGYSAAKTGFYKRVSINGI